MTTDDARMTSPRRYQNASRRKAEGVAYTPTRLADFVAERLIDEHATGARPLRILDPAVGDGALLLGLLRRLQSRFERLAPSIHVFGFETDQEALENAEENLKQRFPDARLRLERRDFLDFALDSPTPPGFDLIIANPPYVRTQILGAALAQKLAETFALSGRVDLSHAFIMATARLLRPDGAAGLITSNRFMTTKAGADLRAALRQRFEVRQIWDFGDSKLFSAAVLPVVLVLKGKNAQDMRSEKPPPALFCSAYEIKATDSSPAKHAEDPIDAALSTFGSKENIVVLKDGRRLRVRHGALDDAEDSAGLWRLTTQDDATWRATVEAHAWRRFGDVGKIRVGVKSCADKVFLRNDWRTRQDFEPPELLRPVATHHIAGRFRAQAACPAYEILYPHEVVNGRRRAIDLSDHPRARAYLESHRAILEARSYVMSSGRQWYELWTPQDPSGWAAPKLVFRDISAQPTFWLDFEGMIVNGDCYWLSPTEPDLDLLWLAAAVANSTFAEAFYDAHFHNKLYAGRRRFITQYVEKFPLPDPTLPLSREIIARARDAVACARDANDKTTPPKPKPKPEPEPEPELDALIWRAFGVSKG